MNTPTCCVTRTPQAPAVDTARWRRVAALAVALVWWVVLAATPLHAQCFTDLQGADDEPGQKDLSQFCSLGSCTGGSSFSWNFDDIRWSGNNTGDACALFDTDTVADGLANRAVCVTITGSAVQQAGSPKCYTCGNGRPDRCTSSTLVPCTSTCTTIGTAADPFVLDPNHTGNKCNGTNCRALDAQTTCCITAGDASGFLLDVCSFPSQNPNSDPSDCVVNPPNCNSVNDPACDDTNPCTVDSCDTTVPGGVCKHVAGNSGVQCRASAGVCDVPEVCDGTSPTCPADQFAQSGICRAASDLCDVAESCDGSGADCPADGVKPSGTVCRPSSGAQCDIAEVCDGTSKACPPDGSQPNNTPCNDGSACTSGDHCLNGSCVGTTIDCNDTNPCTDDGCDPATGCTHVNNSDPCNDNNHCTDNDTCVGGSCQGTPISCVDGNVCTDDSCNPGTGCVFTNNTDACSDNDNCTTPDQCSNGSCVGGGPPNCDDGDACTTDSCVSPGGCVHVGIVGCCNTDPQCADTDQCTKNEHCVNHTCTSEPVDCNDNNGCTDDGCNPATGCTHVNNSDPCDDNNHCTDPDFCGGGSCHGAFIACVDGNLCTDDSCNPGTGCVFTNNTDPCSDDDNCTTNDHCSNGGCVGGPPPTCVDGNPCTDDACVSPTGCVFTNNTASCSDGNGCTENDVCSGGLCTPGSPKNCNDVDPCTDDTCNPQSGLCEHVNNFAPCNDGNVCTGPDHCSNDSCGGAFIDCSDTNFCTDDSCDPFNGGCQHVGRPDCCNPPDPNDPNAPNPCADTDGCTKNERCENHACVSDPVDCTDTDVCTIDSCNSQGGNEACNNTPCIIGNPCPSPNCPAACCPIPCGNGHLDPGETCDPPGSIMPPNGNICRLDCTFCGDTVINVSDGETCDDGNTAEGCDHRQFAIDPCRNDCTGQVCKDPTGIGISSYIDVFVFHARLAINSPVDFLSDSFVVELTDLSGQRVIYRATVPAGGIVISPGRTSAGPFQYVNAAARRSGGVQKFKVKIVKDRAGVPMAYEATLAAYGNLLAAQSDMATNVYAGQSHWTVAGTWEKRGPKRWRFIQP